MFLLSFVILIIFTNLILGILVFLKDRSKLVNISFFSLTVAISGWVLTNYLADNLVAHDTRLLNTKLTMFFGLLLMFLFYYFVSNFIRTNIKAKTINLFLTPAVFIVLVLSFGNGIVSGITTVNDVTAVNFGKLSFLYVLTFFVTLVISVYLLIDNSRNLKGDKKIQLDLLNFGLLISVFLGAISNLLLPFVFNNYKFATYGTGVTLIFVGFTTYAIIKHRLWNIRFVVAKSLAYLILLAILAIFYAGGVLGIERLMFRESFAQISIIQGAVRTLFAVIMAFSFQPLRHWVTKKTDKVFFKGQYDSGDLLAKLSHILGSSIILNELLSQVTDVLTKDVKISRSLFVLLESENKIYSSHSTGYKESINIDPKDIAVLANEQILVLGELEYNSRLKNLLVKYDAELSLPLKTDKGLLGVWLIGEKNSGEAYSQQDYQVFEIITPEIAVAIENAKAYGEISAFNETLKIKINHATRKLEQKNSELLKSGQQLEDLVNFLPDATFAIDMTGRIIIWNKSMEELTGVNAEKMIGKGNKEYSRLFENKSEISLVEQISKRGLKSDENQDEMGEESNYLHAEAYFRNLNGKKTYLGVKAAPLYDQNHNIVGAIESLRDITEIKLVERLLRKNNEELRKIDLAKDDFISMASHQLRTPITAIKGYLSMLIEGDAGEVKISQYDFILEAYRASNRMTGLVNDLLNVSRMEAGRFYLEINQVSLDIIVEEEMKQLEGNVRERGLYLKFKKGKQIPIVSADKTKIRQVIMNFIDNAVYYTRTGGITIELYRENEGVVFTVTDTGIGVPKGQQAKLFQKFYRADNAKNMRPDGTGLGLFLARKVIESHGGKIIFHSTEGKGSVFGFKIPIKNMARKFSVVMPDVSSSSAMILQNASKQNLDLVKK
jgi:PAS domain S-box-containing protein